MKRSYVQEVYEHNEGYDRPQGEKDEASDYDSCQFNQARGGSKKWTADSQTARNS